MKCKLLTLIFLVMLTPTLFAQPSIQYSHGEPTNLEQYMLELINRARANPTQEGIFLDTLDTDYARQSRERKPEFFVNLRQEFASYPPAQPVAFNTQLIQAARLHSQDMINQNYMGHYSPEGTSPSDRMEAQGYSNYTGENVSSSGASIAEEMVDEHFGFMVDHDNAMHDTHPFGHRLNVLGTVHTEVGIGNVVMDSSSRITQDFGATPGRIFLLGVVYQDQNGNNFYDPGEGLDGVTVMPSEGDYFAVTSTSGGYAIPFDVAETRDAGQASTVLSPDSNWSEDVQPVAEEFEKSYRSNPANQSSMTLSLTASGSGLSAPFTQTVTMVKPITVTYRINQTDNVYWPQEFVLGSNVKVDFNIAQPHDATSNDNTSDSTEETTTPPVTDTTDSTDLVWHTSKDQAFVQANQEGKSYIILVACGNREYIYGSFFTSPVAKSLIQQHFVLWFSIANGDDPEFTGDYNDYVWDLWDTSGFGFPVVVVIDPTTDSYVEGYRFGQVQDTDREIIPKLQELVGTSPPNPTPDDNTTTPPTENTLSDTTISATDCYGQQILTADSCTGDDVDTEEAKLHRLVNEYRAQHGLPAIPLSPSLNLVANRHVLDLVDNISSFSRSGLNWLHGWSDCAYDANNRETYSCMWNAPQRLKTAYTGYGYENR